jgi:RHS repeat-associated protein
MKWVEESHYYPFGLLMSGISDKALKNQYAENKNRFNGGNELQNKEFSDGSGLEAYDATFRMYDPQIGRFWQPDPLADVNENSSPYSFVYNNPIKYNDPSGLDTAWKELKTVVVSHKLQQPRASVNVDLADVAPYTPFQHAYFLAQVDYTVATPPTWWQHFTHDIGYRGKNLLGQDIEDPYYGGEAPSGSFSRFNPKDILKLYKFIRNLQWSSRSVAQAAKLLLRGAKEVTVKNKEEAEELFLGLYQAEPKGYTNTTGMTVRDMKDEFMFPKGKEGTYHWDLNDT